MKPLKLLGTLLCCTLLTAACTHDEETTEPVVSADALPIGFSFTLDTTATTRAANGYAGTINQDNHELYYTGFGVFAEQQDATRPDLMFNQRVDYTFYADDSNDGHWNYSPTKYWPAQPLGTRFFAYAPFVDAPNAPLPTGTTGITGMSDNTESSPYIIYTRARHPEDNVDLLWSTFTVENSMLNAEGRPRIDRPVTFTMHHALARVSLSVAVTNGSSLPAGSRLLVKRITLTGNFSSEGRLNLNSTGSTPTWSDQEFSDDDETIFTDCDPETNPCSYGIVSLPARYIAGLPPQWQPDGLPHLDYDADDPDLKDNKTNILSMGDAPTYLYLIPQDKPNELSITAVLDYCIIGSDGTPNDYRRTTATEETPIVISPLSGNKTYNLTFTFTITAPTP